MRIGYHRRRLADFLGGMRLSRELIKHERRRLSVFLVACASRAS